MRRGDTEAGGAKAELTMHSFRRQEERINSADNDSLSYHSIVREGVGMREGMMNADGERTTTASDSGVFCGTNDSKTYVRLMTGQPMTYTRTNEQLHSYPKHTFSHGGGNEALDVGKPSRHFLR